MDRGKRKKKHQLSRSSSTSKQRGRKTDHIQSGDDHEQIELSPPNSSNSGGATRKKKKQDEECAMASLGAIGGEVSNQSRSSIAKVQTDGKANNDDGKPEGQLMNVPDLQLPFVNILNAAQERFDKERKQMQKKLDKEREKLDKERERLVDEHKQLITALCEKAQLQSSLTELNEQMKATEFKYLQVSGKLFPRCIMEHYEEKFTPYKHITDTRSDKWTVLLQRPTLRKALHDMQAHFGNYRFRKPVESLAAPLYERLSEEVHDAFDKGGVAVCIDDGYFSKKEKIFMLAICKALPLDNDKVIILSADRKSTSQMP